MTYGWYKENFALLDIDFIGVQWPVKRILLKWDPYSGHTIRYMTWWKLHLKLQFEQIKYTKYLFSIALWTIYENRFSNVSNVSNVCKISIYLHAKLQLSATG